jgi:hypothetical protein
MHSFAACCKAVRFACAGRIQLPIDRPFEPLSLDDEEMRAIQDAALGVRHRDRGAFLHDLSRELRRHAVLGAGLVSKLARSVAARHMGGAASKARAETRWSEGLPKREPRAKRQQAAG